MRNNRAGIAWPCSDTKADGIETDTADRFPLDVLQVGCQVAHKGHEKKTFQVLISL